MPRGGDYYGTAMVCLNGHVIEPDIDRHSESTSRFCSECGKATITACQNCNEPIRGYHHYENIAIAYHYEPPKFCHGCGNSFPWIAEKLKAAKELTEMLDELNDDEKVIIKESFEDLVQDDANSEVAALKIKRILKKVGSAAKQPLYKFAVDVASETAKKMLTGGTGSS